MTAWNDLMLRMLRAVQGLAGKKYDCLLRAENGIQTNVRSDFLIKLNYLSNKRPQVVERNFPNLSNLSLSSSTFYPKG